MGPAQEVSDRGDPRVTGCGDLGSTLVGGHRPELQDRELAPATAQTGLSEQDRPAAGRLDGRGDSAQQWRQQAQPHPRSHHAQRPPPGAHARRPGGPRRPRPGPCRVLWRARHEPAPAATKMLPKMAVAAETSVLMLTSTDDGDM